MDRLEKIKRHAALFDDMATHVGVDLQEAAIRGAIDCDEISNAVVRCTGCLQPARCSLRVKSAATDGTSTPIYCRNADLLHRLQALV
ncbi:DUF6455 family protein [Shimia sp. MMG029]|uniref:DUF6455 family protein n=1 Tax=Shimia sp. MMG029 TaxID=3021978 RepID=UPI0022FF059D|nr:DUF6455 family protein [Shimia sp. MMG029]MDA5556420.1 DUF6455 family protein [Shimia sp. MMG029]